MKVTKWKMKGKTSLWACLLVLMATLFFTGVVFADSDLPLDPPEGGTPAVEGTLPTEEATDGSPLPVEEIGSEIPGADVPAGGEGITEEPGDDLLPAEDLALDGAGQDPADENAASEEEGTGADAGQTGEPIEPPAQVPDVEIVNQDGEAITAEGGTATVGSDPRWKVGTIWYSVVADENDCYEGTSVDTGTCWVSSTPIATALEKIESGLLPTDKKLYIEEGTFDEGDILISGVYLNQLNGLIGSGSSTTTIIGTITLDGNLGGFTFSGLTITGGIVVQNSAGSLVMTDMNVSNPDGNGLEMGVVDDTPAHGGSVTISDSSFNLSSGSGARINATSTVTVTNSTFNGNGSGSFDRKQAGLYINTTGAINLNGVTASENYGRGLDVDNFSALTAKNIIANSNHNYVYGIATYNGDGISVNPSGAGTGKVTLENVTANDNDHFGICVNGLGIVSLKNAETVDNGDSGIDVQTSNAVTINGARVEDNSAQGIYIASAKTVTLNSITSNFNGANGILVESWGGVYPTLVTISSPKSGGGIMANHIEGNGEDGVRIFAKGQITLTNIDSLDNTGWGLNLDNCLYNSDTGLCTGSGNVTVNVTTSNWVNGITGNSGYGLWVKSKGVVAISQTTTSNNGFEGTYVDTQGAIKLSQVTASNNGRNGAYLTNLSAPKGQLVSVLDSIFDQNQGMGVYVLTAGAITFNGSSAKENYSPTVGGLLDGSVTVVDNFIGSDGREVWGFYGNAGDEIDIIVEEYDFQSVVTLYNSIYEVIASESGNYLDSNHTRIVVTLTSSDWYSIEVSYSGDFDGMTTYKLMFNDPDQTRIIYPGSGALLDNSAAKANVTVSTTTDNLSNAFDGNASYGLKVNSYGTISITNPSASNNYRAGLMLDNPSSTGSVTILNKNAELGNVLANNGWTGLTVSTLGNIVLSGLTAQDNSHEGYSLENCQYDFDWGACLGKGTVTLTNLVSDRNGIGMYVFSSGNITLTNVSGSNNFYGITLNNEDGAGNVTLKNVTSTNNNDTGINIFSNGQVTLSAVVAKHNFKTHDYFGVGDAVSDYYNADVSADQWGFDAEEGEEYTIRLYAASENSNWDVNNFIGSLALFDGDGNAVSFDSVDGGGTNALTATWTAGATCYYYLEVSEASGNSGFYRLSINNDLSDDNSLNYYYVDGLTIQTQKNVIFSGKDVNDLSHNSLTGLFVITQGNISLLNMRVNSNGTEGAVLDNSSGYGTVTVNGLSDNLRSTFNSNGWQGLQIKTSGTVSLNNLTSIGNGNKGIEVDNTYAVLPKAVTAKNLNLYANDSDGLSVLSNGNITLSNINAQGNGANGVYANNDYGNPLVKVTLSGDNYFWNSGADGLHVETSGTATLSGIDARYDGSSGIFVTAPMGISLSKAYVKASSQDGIDLESSGAVTLTDVSSFDNVRGEDSNGLSINMHQEIPVVIRNSAFMGNEGHGIFIAYTTPHIPQPVLTNTVYAGNDTDDDGDANLKIANFH
ncbi:MAG: putative surface-exposed virulence protein [Chloroflexota bacterium]|nr:putative surface-exposed virulence protein [Chloroflexota bacterium]